jgi:CTP synthase
LAWTTNIPKDHIISAPNVDSIYRVPLTFEQQGLTDKILHDFGMSSKKSGLKDWKKLVTTISQVKNLKKEVNIAVVGKYFETGSYQISDVYISVVEAIKHASWANKVKVNLNWVSSADVEKHGAKKTLSGYAGIVVPGGFGSRGTEGIIETIKYARTQRIPYLGLCYGMQLATIEFARNVAKLRNANTTEVNEKTKYPVIHIMPEQEKLLLNKEYGATMRLGAWDCTIKRGTHTEKAYIQGKWINKTGSAKISERHRHRYEFNNEYREILEEAGLVISGTTPDNQLVEIIELKDHPYFVGSQFHPEFKSRPLAPHPLFLGFMQAVKKINK